MYEIKVAVQGLAAASGSGAAPLAGARPAAPAQLPPSASPYFGASFGSGSGSGFGGAYNPDAAAMYSTAGAGYGPGPVNSFGGGSGSASPAPWGGSDLSGVAAVLKQYSPASVNGMAAADEAPSVSEPYGGSMPPVGRPRGGGGPVAPAAEQPTYPQSFHEVMEMLAKGITPPNVRVGLASRP